MGLSRKQEKDSKNLFDIIEQDEVREGKKCEHRRERKTETNWPGIADNPRLTWTCETCGRIRGRC